MQQQSETQTPKTPTGQVIHAKFAPDPRKPRKPAPPAGKGGQDVGGVILYMRPPTLH